MKTFGKPERLLACECERSNETTLKQALTLIGDEGLNNLLTSGANRLSRLAASDLSHGEVVEELYWHALGREPSADERDAAASLLNQAEGDRLPALQDLAWALLNAKEFVFRH